jgi:hypothetical protein
MAFTASSWNRVNAAFEAKSMFCAYAVTAVIVVFVPKAAGIFVASFMTSPASLPGRGTKSRMGTRGPSAF